MNKIWKELTLSNLCTLFTDGDWIETKDQSANGIRLVQTGNIGIGHFKNRTDKARYISQETFKRLNCQEIFHGDCLVSRLPDPVGRACIMPELDERMITAVDCTIMRFNKSLVIPKFFIYYSQSIHYLNEISIECTGTTRKRISRKKLGNIKFLIPNIEEQKRIIVILDKAFKGIDEAIANTEKNLADARELFESYLNDVFSKKGEGWVEKAIGDFSEVFDGPHATPKTVDSGPIFLGISSLQDGKINLGKTRHVTDDDFKKWTRRVRPREGDIVFSYETRLGQAAIIPKGLLCCLGRRMGLVRVDTNLIEPKFFLYQYISPVYKHFLKSRTIQGATVDRIPLKDFPYFPFGYPDVEKQKCIVEQVDSIATQVLALDAMYQKKLVAFSELKQSLLQKAFAGELTKDFEINTEEEAVA